MKSRGRSDVITALMLFLVLATAGEIFVAALYSRGAERVRVTPSLDPHHLRIFARPVRIVAGEQIAMASVIDHLQAIGYYDGCAGEPGCYAVRDRDHSLTIWARYPELPDVTLYWNGDRVAAISTPSGGHAADAAIEPETIVVLVENPAGVQSRASQEPLPYSAVRGTALADAIVSSEDRWFQSHHGLDFTRLAMTPVTRSGASTITMQVARLNVLRDSSRTISRKLNEIGVAMAIDRTHSRQEIFTAYVNSVGLGARNGRPVIGFGAAAREFFGVTDVRRLSDLQAATLVALLNQPSRYLGNLTSGNDAVLRRQRNRVLRLMHRTFPERYSDSWLDRLESEPVVLATPETAPDALQRVSRNFLDYAAANLPSVSDGRIYLTLDANLQRAAMESLDQGLSDLERRVPVPFRPQLQAALVAVDPRTGQILAMVGGRSYDRSQLNRAVNARRQVGSILKPFDYLAAFERAQSDGRTDISESTTVADVPTVFRFRGWQPWQPANYENNYAGVVTWRRALAESRNVAAVKVASFAGFDRVAGLWEAATGQHLQGIFPSLALGSVDATPIEVARGYAAFATEGIVRPLEGVGAVIADGVRVPIPARPASRIAGPETVRIVADMMRAVMDEGTGRGARAAGFTLPAAGKTGTTNLLRDAWFAGFSGDLLAVVWVGRDDAQPLGFSGAQAALPIWTSFMKRALQPAAPVTRN